tara:strand:- start:6998 stop:7450 length:453 start_codon:yes stop_codon:yes gene_type:complete
MYKQIKVPNTFFRWHAKHIFPIYPAHSGSRVSQRRINRLKPLAMAILQQEEKKIETTFRTYLRKKYQGRIKVNLGLGLNKIQQAKLCPSDEGMYGESDETTIWVAKDKLSDSHLLGVLLHEALHYMCTIDGRDVNTADEHKVMQLLGDDC